jgi:hypothetical protein
MIDQDGVRALRTLVRTELRALKACDQALLDVESRRLGTHLKRLRLDHERHLDALSGVLERYGLPGAPSETSAATITARGDTEGALRAIKAREQAATVRYRQATRVALPEDVREIVSRGRDDIGRALTFVEEALEWRTWEPRPS